ncbi:PaaI family thioesterase [Desulfosporosinus shakirovi]|uniref:PaaI family thioesterase n=1 Tax=Desulfosporosinus shakirovi TaxID=2885154 RepID=UPI001E4F8B2F|nr:PaaI family thioesterase [Desulfosporosinus sp. SRJS8]MCB8817076.1 PaaI family thioesterase [Desulfosporosinus sp. SRJS8]
MDTLYDSGRGGERKRTIVWDDPQINKRDAVSAISGLDYLRSIRDGKIGPPPAAKLIGYQLKDVDYGFAAFELHPGEHHYNPFATVHGGILSTLMDTAMTAAVLTTLPQNITCSTVEIKVNFIKPVTAESKLVLCEARIIHSGRKLATVEGRIKGGNDELYAHGVSTCLIFKIN